jgi:predicted Zn-dependent protease
MKVQVMNFMGDYKAAIEFIKPYTKYNKENDTLWVVLADVHESRGNRSAALDALKKAKAILESKDKGPHYKENMNEIITRISHLEQFKDTEN